VILARGKKKHNVSNLSPLSSSTSTSTPSLSHFGTMIFVSSSPKRQKLTHTNALGGNPCPSTRYGAGLRLALKRSKDTDRFYKEISTFLSAVATTYDQLGLGLLRTSQSIRPQNRLPFQTRIDMHLQILYDTNTTFANEHRSQAKLYRSTITSRLSKILTDHATQIEATISQYNDARLGCWTARQLALSRCATYDGTVRAAEMEIQEFLSEQSSDGMTQDDATGRERNVSEGLEAVVSEDPSPWEKALRRLGTGNNQDRTNRLIQKLHAVVIAQMEYERGVIQENEAIRAAQTMEINALRNVQKIEEERLDFFSSSVVATICRRGLDSENIVTASPRTSQMGVDLDSAIAEGLEKKGKDLLAALFSKQSLPYEEGMGVMDAETLGLPEEIGLLRDNVKSIFSARERRIKTCEVLFRVVVEMADLASKTASALKSRGAMAESGIQKYVCI
jgi:hypothetical protein